MNAWDAVKKRCKRTQNGFFRLICLLLLTMATIGCPSSTKQDVFDLPCGRGHLVLHEIFVPGFSIDTVTLELRYRTDRRDRLVCVLKKNFILYRDPTPEEHYQHFRGGVQSDPWPVFVNPKVFTPAEYGQISRTLSKNIDEIDAAVGQRGQPTKRFYANRKPRISSIRYIDITGLHRLYVNPDKRLKLEVKLNGQVWLLAEDMKSIMAGTNIGYVVSNGSKVVLDPNPYAATHGTDGIVTDLPTFARQCVDEHGRSLYDDFTVEVPSTVEAYKMAGRAWMKRCDSRR
ncbi:MAG: hypothetical protein JEZ11_11245 [Desulfobacterales bacterium]|nr:hypothetical protein [Desulfobacterales bacterium]